MSLRVVILGREGQVARALADEAKGDEITASFLGRNDYDLASATEAGFKDIIAHHGPHMVINAAAYTAVDKAEEEREAAFKLNCSAPEMVAKACASAQIPLLHLSTDYVFDGTKPSPYKESDAVCPVSVYGESKEAGEAAIRALSGPHIILRTAWVYSPYGHNFVKTMLRLAQSRDELSIVSDQKGCPTSAAEIARAVLSLCSQLSRKAGPYGTYHYCGGAPMNWYDFARAIFTKTAELGGKVPERLQPITTEHYPTPAKRPANSVLDCSKLARDFAIRPPAFESELDNCLKQLMAKEA